MEASPGLIPAAFTRTTTSPSPGVGASTSTTSSTSTPPYRSNRTACGHHVLLDSVEGPVQRVRRHVPCLICARSICDRPEPWTFSLICSSARGRAGRAFAHTTVARRLGGALPGGAAASPSTRSSRARRICGPRTPSRPCGCCPATSCSCASPASTRWRTRPGAPVHPVRRPAARRHRAPTRSSRATARRRCSSAAPTTSRAISCAADCSIRCPRPFRLRPEPGSTLRATMDLLGREMLRDEPGPAGAAGPAARRRAGAGPARALHGERRRRAPAWFRASGDPHVGAALRALHADPARPWTVADLAGRGEPVALGLRPALHRAARRGAARVPHASGGWRSPASACATATSGSPRSPQSLGYGPSSRSRRRSSATTAPRPAAGGPRRARRPKQQRDLRDSLTRKRQRVGDSAARRRKYRVAWNSIGQVAPLPLRRSGNDVEGWGADGGGLRSRPPFDVHRVRRACGGRPRSR